MKNLRLLFLFIVFSLCLSSVPIPVHAISSNTSITGVTQEKSKIGEKISSIIKKYKTKVQEVLKNEERKKSLFWLYAILLIVLGMILGIGLITAGILVGFSAAGSSGVGAVVLILLGIFLPIIVLFFSFRALLSNHYKKIGKEVTKGIINLYSLAFSIAPGILAILGLALI